MREMGDQDFVAMMEKLKMADGSCQEADYNGNYPTTMCHNTWYSVAVWTDPYCKKPYYQLSDNDEQENQNYQQLRWSYTWDQFFCSGNYLIKI